MSVRFDRGIIRKAERTPEGFLICDATIARTGIQKYLNQDGSVHYEYRPEEEVSDPDSLASLGLKPVTYSHPPEMVTANNAKSYMVGMSGNEIVYDKGFVRAVLTITDKETIDAIERKEATEVSVGYTTELDRTPGEYKGQKFHAIQRKIRGNHHAVVRKARAGPEARLHLDGIEDSEIGWADTQVREDKQITMAKIRIHDAEYEVSEAVAAAYTAQRREDMKHTAMLEAKLKELEVGSEEYEKLKAEIEALKAKKDAAEGRADQLEEEVKQLKTSRTDTSDEAIAKRVRERLDLYRKASPLLKDEQREKLDSLSDLEIMKAVIRSKSEKINLDDKSSDYIAARFDAIVETFDSSKGLQQAADTVRVNPLVDKKLDEIEAKFINDYESAWKHGSNN